jgi:hypothetical protein
LFGEAAFRRLKLHALSKGGECLGRVYVNAWTEMPFRCARGHVWRARPVRITTTGSWCPQCRQEDKLEKLQAIARANGGECLSRRYDGAYTRYRMRCAAGHAWKTKAIFISAGHWCPICRLTGRPPAHSIEDARRAARVRGGRLLSSSYRRVDEKLLFECEAGHRFHTTLSKVLSDGTWCRRCAIERQRLGIGAALEAAKRRGGRCLSARYLNKDQKLEWECAKGHRWRTALRTIRRGSWCPLCNKPRRLTLEDMHAVAGARGGRCLSKRFKNTATHLLWECADRHQWRATPKNVRQHHTWCPDCARGLRAEEIEIHRKALRGLGKAADRVLAAAAEERVRKRPKKRASF